MANRSFLTLSQSGDPSDEPRAATILVAASTCYPVLWWSIFEQDDITLRTERWEDEDGDQVPVEIPTLITTRARAIQRAKDRSDVFFSYFPASYESYYRQWLALLDSVDTPYIHLLTDEIAMMSEPVMIPPHIVRYEREFQRVNTYGCAFTSGNIDTWEQLLLQVQITLNRNTRTLLYFNTEYKGKGEFLRRELTESEVNDVVGYRLRGYYWERPVPWAED